MSLGLFLLQKEDQCPTCSVWCRTYPLSVFKDIPSSFILWNKQIRYNVLTVLLVGNHRCVVSCGSASFPWLVFFFGALLWGSTIHKHTGRWVWQGSVSAGSWTTRRSDDRKEIQTAVVWSCFLFIRSGQNDFARHNERGKKTRWTKKEVGRQHQGMDRPGVRQVPEGSGEQGKMEKTGWKIVCGAPATLAVKVLMMIMMTVFEVQCL